MTLAIYIIYVSLSLPLSLCFFIQFFSWLKLKNASPFGILSGLLPSSTAKDMPAALKAGLCLCLGLVCSLLLPLAPTPTPCPALHDRCQTIVCVCLSATCGCHNVAACIVEYELKKIYLKNWKGQWHWVPLEQLGEANKWRTLNSLTNPV